MEQAKIIFISVVFCFQVFAFCISKACAEGAGTSACATLTQPVSAKIAGMGDAYCAMSGEIADMHYNPAGLSSIQGLEISTIYQRGFDEDNFACILIGRDLPFGAIGASILYYSTGKIQLFDFQGNELNKVGQKDIVSTVGVGVPLCGDDCGIGVNIKGISSEIFGETASAVALDAGIQHSGLIKNTSFGLAVHNLGTELKYLSEGEKLPLNVKLGASYIVEMENQQLLTNIDMPYFVNEKETLGLIGIQYVYNDLLAVRGGYKINFSNSSSVKEQNMTFGVGFIWNSFSLDYSIGITENLSNPHYVSFGVKL